MHHIRAPDINTSVHLIDIRFHKWHCERMPFLETEVLTVDDCHFRRDLAVSYRKETRATPRLLLFPFLGRNESYIFYDK